MAMAVHELTSRAVERVRLRLPGLAPDSAEVVALARETTFVVVRTAPSGLVVLDRSGRPVRSRERLAAIGAHMRTTTLLARALSEGRLDHRREHAERSIALLRQGARGRGPLARRLAATCDQLRGLVTAIDAAEQAARPREAPLTERTARRAALLLNVAAMADRAVVAETRRLAVLLLRPPDVAPSLAEEKLLRWAVARLGSIDLPLFMPELDRLESDRWIATFVVSARATAAAMST
jgi:hypothetical protein